LSERRFFGQFVGTDEPPVDELLPPGETPSVAAYIDKYVGLCKRRLPQFAAGTTEWWLKPRPFFGGLVRERVWVFWRRVLHTCHHRTQVQTWLRLAGHTPVPAIYGPSGDVKWDEAAPTYSLEAAKRGGETSAGTRRAWRPAKGARYEFCTESRRLPTALTGDEKHQNQSHPTIARGQCRT